MHATHPSRDSGAESVEAIATAIANAGGPAQVAGSFGVTAQCVCFWRDGKRRMPTDHMADLERLSGFKVRRWRMRPRDWHRIWPELIGAAGAPAVPDHAALAREAG